MPIPQLPGINDNPTLKDIHTYILRLERQLRFLLESGLDSANAFEFGGWRVKDDMIVSKDGDVGMSTQDTATDDVRFFAGPNGEVWFYYVTKSGKLYATNAFIEGRIEGSEIIGSEIKTSDDSFPRVEISSLAKLFAAYASATNAIKIITDYTGGITAFLLQDGSNNALINFSGGTLLVGTSTAGTDISISAADVLALGGNIVDLNPTGPLTINGTAGSTATVTYVKEVIAGAPIYGTMLFKKGLLTSWT